MDFLFFQVFNLIIQFTYTIFTVFLHYFFTNIISANKNRPSAFMPMARFYSASYKIIVPASRDAGISMSLWFWLPRKARVKSRCSRINGPSTKTSIFPAKLLFPACHLLKAAHRYSLYSTRHCTAGYGVPEPA